MAHLHSVYDSDSHFKIDSVTRAVKNASQTKTMVVQRDHNSERFTFEIPRYIDGHDMSTCNVVQVHYINIDSKTAKDEEPLTYSGVYEVDDLQISPDGDDVVICSWLISGNATQYVGNLSFVVRFACTSDDGTIDYAWNTAKHTNVYVTEGIYNGDVIAEEYADILAQWKQELIDAGVDALTLDKTLLVEGEAADAKAAGDAIQKNADAIADIKIALDGTRYDTAGNAVRGQIQDIARNFKKGRNLIDPERIVGGYFDNSGDLQTGAIYSVTTLIPVKPNTAYWYAIPSAFLGNINAEIAFCRFVAYYNANREFMSADANTREFTTPNDAAFVRLSMYSEGFSGEGEYPCLFEGVFSCISVAEHPYGHSLDSEVDGGKITDSTVTAAKLGTDVLTTGKNLFNKENVEGGFLVAVPDSLQASASYCTSEYIPVSAGVTYTVSPRLRMYALYDVNRDTVLYNQNDADTGASVTITPEQDGFLRVSLYTGNLDNLQIEQGKEATAFEAYERKFAGGIGFSNSQKGYVSAEIEKAETRIGENIAEVEAAVDDKIRKISANSTSELFLTKNLFTGVEVVEGHYYNWDGEQASGRYNYFKNISLPAGTYTILPAARFVYVEATGETLNEPTAADGNSLKNPFTLTLDTDSICHITVFGEDNYSAGEAIYKLFANEYTEDEVEPIGEYTLNEDKVKIGTLAEVKEETTRTSNSVSNLLNAFTTKNLFTGAELVEDAYYNGYEASSSGMVVHYNYFKEIHLPAGTYTVYPRSRFVYNLTTKQTIAADGTTTFTLAEDAVCSITVYMTDSNYKLFSSEYTADDVEIVGDYTLASNIHANGSGGLYEYRNMLTGKKWYACGDSFTADGYGTSDQPKFTDGLYAGENMVYPFFIGRRCGIKVTNLAVGGQTMAVVDGLNNCFSDGIYQNVGADADYITIRLGINDDNKDVAIGTINDTTNTTFYGAWNVVMEYLITNHPFAHIGIIVPNGASLEYVEAVKAIAVKWGIPYLDFATGEQTPLLHRTCRTEVSSVARNLRHNAFIVSNTNTHPNADAHEYQSYCIENWLMSL